jgi:hypothetical protein
MDRKQGLKLVELFFDRVADRFGLQAIDAIPSLEGQQINLLNAADPTKGTDELFQLANDPYGLKSIAYATASNFRTALIRHLHNQYWEIVCKSYATLFGKNVDPDLISFTLSSFKHMIEQLQYPADNNPEGEPFIPRREKLFSDYSANIEGSHTKGSEAIKGIIWEVMSDLQEITQKSQDLRAAALEAIAGDHAFDGKTEWDTVPNEQSRATIEQIKSDLQALVRNDYPEPKPIKNWLSILIENGVIHETVTEAGGKYWYPIRSMTELVKQLKRLCKELGVSEPKKEEIHKIIKKPDGSSYNLKSVKNA